MNFLSDIVVSYWIIANASVKSHNSALQSTEIFFNAFGDLASLMLTMENKHVTQRNEN